MGKGLDEQGSNLPAAFSTSPSGHARVGGNDGFAAALASLDRTLAFAEWASQAPPSSEPGTAAMTLNEMLNKIVGELARIAACYDLKQASENFQDSSVLGGAEDPGSLEKYEEGQQNLNEPWTGWTAPAGPDRSGPPRARALAPRGLGSVAHCPAGAAVSLL